MDEVEMRRRTENVQHEFDATVRSLSPSAPDIAREILEKLSIRPNAPPAWTAQFTPFTLLYPQLQAEFLRSAPELELRANVAHLLLLTHVFVEDRFFDGQVQLNSAEVLLMKQFLIKAFSMLDELLGANREFRNWREAVVRTNAQMCFSSYDRLYSAESALRRSSVTRIAAGRAAYGKIAPVALLIALGCDTSRLRIMKNAFDCFVVGMQWLDDLEDWPEDLSVNDENIVLTLLRRVGPNPYLHPSSAVRNANVGYALSEHGLVIFAAHQARRFFQLAAKRQRILGCITLGNLLDRKRRVAMNIALSVLQAIEDEVARAQLKLGLN